MVVMGQDYLLNMPEVIIGSSVVINPFVITLARLVGMFL